MTFEEFKDDMEIALGGNLISVELEDVDYTYALKAAIRKFKQYGANNFVHGFVKVDVLKGDSVMALPSDVDVVVKILRPNVNSSVFSSEDLFVRKAIDSMFINSGRVSSCGGFNFLEYEMMLQKQEKLQRYSATDVDFNHNKFTNMLTIYNKPTVDESWYVECYSNLTTEQYAEIDWVFEWSKSECMLILGSAYRKFSGGIAGPNSDLNLEGSSMIQEAREIQRQLMEDAQNGMSGDTDYYQIRMG